jgi:HK97 family phage prohead protease
MARRILAFLFSRTASPQSVAGGAGWSRPEAEHWLRSHGRASEEWREDDGELRCEMGAPAGTDGVVQTTALAALGVHALVARSDEPGADDPLLCAGVEQRREHAVLRFEIDRNAAGDARTGKRFRGIATAFGVLVDTWPLRTLIQPEAFDDSLSEDRELWKVLWQHDQYEPIGKPTSMRRVGNGIEVEGVISETQRGRDAMTLLRDGVIDSLSIGFDAIRTSLTKMNGEEIRLLEKGKLWEVSLVTWPANRAARITQVNSRQEPAAAPGPEAPALLPLAPIDYAWDEAAARQRVRLWAEKGADLDWTRYAQAFLHVDGEAPEKLTSYHSQFADVVEGELRAVPAALFHASLVYGFVGEAPSKPMLERYYAALGRIPPWKRSPAQHARTEALASVPAEQRSEELTRWCRETLLRQGEEAGLFSGDALARDFVAARLDAAICAERRRAAAGDAAQASASLHAITGLQGVRRALLGAELPADGRDVPAPAQPVDQNAVDEKLAQAARALPPTRR